MEASRSTVELAIREAEKPVKIRKGQAVTEAQAIDAVFQARTKAALEGSIHAQRDMIADYERGLQKKEEDAQRECEIWSRLVRGKRQMIAEAAEKGAPPPIIYPHPDDIVIEPGVGVRFLGPVTEEHAASIKKSELERDAYLMQHVLDCRRHKKSKNKRPGVEPFIPHFLAHLIDQQLPERHRLTEGQWISRFMKFDGMTQRELEKQLYRRWKELGMSFRRGRSFPAINISQFEKDLKSGIQKLKSGTS